jgi:hypothetical protein
MVCIQVPMLATNDAIHRMRKAWLRSGAHADVPAGRPDILLLGCRRCGHGRSVTGAGAVTTAVRGFLPSAP